MHVACMRIDGNSHKPGAAAMSTICSPSWGARAMTGRKEEAPCSM